MIPNSCRRVALSCCHQLRHCSNQACNKRDKLAGKVAIVTGSTDGIGLAISKKLAENGAKVLISSRKQENVTRAVESLQSSNLEVKGVICDVGNNDDRMNLVDTAIKEFGQLDIMVSNAGINTVSSTILKTQEEAWDQIFDINVKSGYLLAKECGPHLKKSKGSMLFIGSVVGYIPITFLGAYSVSKTAVIGLIKALAQECAPSGVRVNGIAPGIIKTEMSATLTDSPAISKRLMAMAAMKRFGIPDDIAGAAVFLSSDEASYITGEILNINGGMNTRL